MSEIKPADLDDLIERAGIDSEAAEALRSANGAPAAGSNEPSGHGATPATVEKVEI